VLPAAWYLNEKQSALPVAVPINKYRRTFTAILAALEGFTEAQVFASVMLSTPSPWVTQKKNGCSLVVL
jgi:hypothetical protein